ncbi:hypothetical protein MKW98_016775 [Papaver atlanticum]|uniref:non-specific serine/threonine protein kinase n=1 Tax=Papaver atlanticum TaxID=357466 RepID=A0AAD4XVR8_9MAGN|nr:hypothetical protein MKW98_016775 [Papaver atlanticum]
MDISGSASNTNGGENENAEMSLLHYKLGKTLGIGAFSKVKLADHIPTGIKVAIKIYNRRKLKKMKMNEDKVMREIKAMRLLFMHPHVIRLYEVIVTPCYIYLVTEWAKNGELFDYLVEKGRLQDYEARYLFQQIISGVEYCHSNMVAHRDLKPENLLLDSNDNVKIADFGLSNFMRDGRFLETNCGSWNYAAPEVLSGEPYAGPEVDVWSCGVILYALLCGALPFDDENISNLLRKIKGGSYYLPTHLSTGASDLIPRMLLVDPIKRITISEIRQHPWFQVYLPRNLVVPLPNRKQQTTKIDDRIIQKVVLMGFNRDLVIKSLCSRKQNQATVAYQLLMDNNFNGTTRTSSITHNISVGIHVHKKRALGIQSKAHPQVLMNEVLKALKEMKVCWKKIGSYNMKCCTKWFPPLCPTGENDQCTASHNNVIDDNLAENGARFKSLHIVKFEIQLYKGREEKNYVLDFQRVNGSQVLFLDICAAIFTQVGVI